MNSVNRYSLLISFEAIRPCVRPRSSRPRFEAPRPWSSPPRLRARPQPQRATTRDLRRPRRSPSARTTTPRTTMRRTASGEWRGRSPSRTTARPSATASACPVVSSVPLASRSRGPSTATTPASPAAGDPERSCTATVWSPRRLSRPAAGAAAPATSSAPTQEDTAGHSTSTACAVM